MVKIVAWTNSKILRTEVTEMFGKYVQNLSVIITVFLSSVSSNITVQAFLHMFLLGSISLLMKDLLLKFQTLVSPRYLKEIFLYLKCLPTNTNAKNMLAVKMRSLLPKCNISLE